MEENANPEFIPRIKILGVSLVGVNYIEMHGINTPFFYGDPGFYFYNDFKTKKASNKKINWAKEGF